MTTLSDVVATAGISDSVLANCLLLFEKLSEEKRIYLLQALRDAGTWFSYLYTDGSDYSHEPVEVHAASRDWEYSRAIDGFKTLKKLGLHKIIRDEARLHRLHDMSFCNSQRKPRMNDVCTIKPHKSCLSFSRMFVDEVPGRSDSNFDAIIEAAFAAEHILWTWDCREFLAKECQHACKALKEKRLTPVMWKPDISSSSALRNYRSQLASKSALHFVGVGKGKDEEAKRTVALMVELLRCFVSNPLREENEVIVNTSLKPFHARIVYVT